MACKNLNYPKLLHEIKNDEGCVEEIYKDHLGYLTFGVGHLIKETDPEFGKEVGTPVSMERVDAVFSEDVERATGYCANLYKSAWQEFPGEVKMILTNMMFNLGPGNLAKFKKMNAALGEGDWEVAAIEGRDSLWYKQVTNRAERLMSRLEVVDG
jgi:lysozyme